MNEIENDCPSGGEHAGQFSAVGAGRARPPPVASGARLDGRRRDRRRHVRPYYTDESGGGEAVWIRGLCGGRATRVGRREGAWAGGGISAGAGRQVQRAARLGG